RELVKDIEDRDGDEAAGYTSYPIAHGVAATKKVLMYVAILLGIVMLCFALYLIRHMNIYAFIWFVSLALIPFGGLVYFIRKAVTKKQYYQLSQWIKLHMLL